MKFVKLRFREALTSSESGTDGARTHDLPHVKRTLIPAELRFHPAAVRCQQKPLYRTSTGNASLFLKFFKENILSFLRSSLSVGQLMILLPVGPSRWIQFFLSPAAMHSYALGPLRSYTLCCAGPSPQPYALMHLVLSAAIRSYAPGPGTGRLSGHSPSRSFFLRSNSSRVMISRSRSSLSFFISS